LEECVATNFVSSVGPFVDRFEREFARFVGAPYAVACASGTAAIHVALRLIDLQPGDEVFVSTLTFIASANPILYERGVPVLVDSERESWNLDPARVLDELNRRARSGQKQPRAVMAVHILGHPVNINPIAAACDKHGVMLVEDCAEALGARYQNGAHIGGAGRVACFSFNGNKIMTTGGGGMITTADGALAKRAKHLTTQARLAGAEYRHDELGYNYRLTNLAAALGVAQLEQLPEFLRKKRAIADRYDAALGRKFECPPRAPWAQPSHWLYSMLVPDRVALHARLADQQIETRPIWTPLHLMPLYRGCQRLGGEVAESLFARGLSLPCSVALDEAAQDKVIRVCLDG
jgi:dTDP-4-amino-4,6-dideoxygalactose transaminase